MQVREPVLGAIGLVGVLGAVVGAVLGMWTLVVIGLGGTVLLALASALDVRRQIAAAVKRMEQVRLGLLETQARLVGALESERVAFEERHQELLSIAHDLAAAKGKQPATPVRTTRAR